MRQSLEVLTCTIPAESSVSNTVNLLGMQILGIEFPTGWTPADLTFKGSPDGIKMSDIYDASGDIMWISVNANGMVNFPYDCFPGVGYIQLQSGTTSVPRTQSAQRVFKLIVRNRT